MESENVIKTGTTTVGIVCKDGIVLAADKRATAGYLIASKKTEKIHQISENIAVTMAGTASDAQLLVKIARAELKLKALRTGQEISVKEAANLISRLVYDNIRKFSSIPGISQFILAGKDSKGFGLYDLFPDGTIEECEDYMASGSGSVMAFGVLETLYRKGMSIDEGIKLAVKCLNAAIQRDIASGSGFDVVTITNEGVKKVLEKDINAMIQA
ncbi:MAG: proteasome subunit beta [Candidatus Woesearchaeota archaeon]